MFVVGRVCRQLSKSVYKRGESFLLYLRNYRNFSFGVYSLATWKNPKSQCNVVYDGSVIGHAKLAFRLVSLCDDKLCSERHTEIREIRRWYLKMRLENRQMEHFITARRMTMHRSDQIGDLKISEKETDIATRTPDRTSSFRHVHAKSREIWDTSRWDRRKNAMYSKNEKCHSEEDEEEEEEEEEE